MVQLGACKPFVSKFFIASYPIFLDMPMTEASAF